MATCNICHRDTRSVLLAVLLPCLIHLKDDSLVCLVVAFYLAAV
jgi:hypothetical protein